MSLHIKVKDGELQLMAYISSEFSIIGKNILRKTVSACSHLLQSFCIRHISAKILAIKPELNWAPLGVSTSNERWVEMQMKLTKETTVHSVTGTYTLSDGSFEHKLRQQSYKAKNWYNSTSKCYRLGVPEGRRFTALTRTWINSGVNLALVEFTLPTVAAWLDFTVFWSPGACSSCLTSAS